MFCPKCGAEIPDGSTFCPSCGAQLGGAENAGAQQNAQPNSQMNNQYNPNQYNSNQYNPNQYNPQNDDKHSMAIVAYITWIGWVIAIATTSGNRSPFVTFHINQALVIWLFSLLGFIPVVGWIWSIFMVVCWILGLVSACQGTMKEVPLIGKIHLIKS